MYTVSLEKFIQKMKVKNLTPDVDISAIEITQSDVNRPALQLAGFFDYFDHHRIQIIGQVEHTYMEKQGIEESLKQMQRILSYKVPGIVFCRDLPVPEEFLRLANEFEIPILQSHADTSAFSAEVTRWLKVELAPRISIHGVLVDIYGEGVLITGESGIGKSEVALELIHRGHRLVSDDVVEIKKVSDETLIGSAPDITRHFIELRGIGIVNARRLFGMGAVKTTEKIDFIINLEVWDDKSEYDRMGIDKEYTEILDIKVPVMTIPVRQGRNLAVIIEVAAMNNREKTMGYNAAKDLMEHMGMDPDIMQPQEKKIDLEI